jgi:hypothetical protein
MRVAVAVLVAGSLLCLPEVARAEVFHDGEALDGGEFELGFEGEFLFNPAVKELENESLVYGHFGFGISHNLDLAGRMSFFSDDTLFGGDLQYGPLDDGEGYPAFSVYGGGHFVDLPDKKEKADYWGIDAGLTLSESIIDQVFYIGYDVDVNFLPENDRPTLDQRVVLGARIIISEHLSFFVEAGYAPRSRDEETRHYVSGGPKLYF